MQRIQVSKVLKPKGLKGELKVSLFVTFSPKVIFIDDKEYKVIRHTEYGGFSYLVLDGVNDITQAEHLRGKEIYMNSQDVVLNDDEILNTELVGYIVVDETGKERGVVKGIENYGASDIIDCGDFMFPYVDAFVIETNTKKRTLYVRSCML